MKTITTEDQRRAWYEVNQAITNYCVKYGPIEVGEEDGLFFLDLESRYTECGKISCPDYRFSFNKKSFPWYEWIKNKWKNRG